MRDLPGAAPFAIETAIGTGRSNTQKIVDILGNGSYAAKLCSDLTQGGYDDWFMPSKDELNLMFENLHLNGIGGFNSGCYYWSSSEFSNDGAWGQGFSNGEQNWGMKGGMERVRAVRAF